MNDGDGDGGGEGGKAGSGGTTSGRGGTAGTSSGRGGSGGDSGSAGRGGNDTGGSGPGPMGGAGIGGASGDSSGTGAGTGGSDASGAGGTDGGGDGGTDGGTDGGAGAGAGGSDAGMGGDGPDPVLEAYYPFDEGTGTTAADTTGNFGVATLLDGAAWTPGRTGGQALLLDNGEVTDTQHVLLPGRVLADCDDTTLALWARLAADGDWSRFFDADGLVDGFIYFTPAGFVGPDRGLLFNMFSTPLPDMQKDQRVFGMYPSGTVMVGEWHHFAVTIQGSVGRVFFDGVEIGSNATLLVTPSDVTVAPTAVAKVGKSMFPDPYLNGAIDDLRISCRAYTAQEIAVLAQ